MNFQELQSALAIPSDKVLRISKGLLTDEVDHLIDAVFGGKAIEITQAVRGVGDRQDDTVVIEGTGALLRTGDVQVTARFRLVDATTIEAVLRFALASDWTFATSFPDLPKSIDWSRTTKDAEVIALDALDLSDRAFLASATDGARDPISGAVLQSGLNFVATLTPSLALEAAKALFGQSDPMILSGPIDLDESGPEAGPLVPGQYPWSRGVTAPGISLCADMTGGGAEFDALRFDGVQFRIYAPITKGWLDAHPDFAPVQAYSGALQVPSADLSIRMTTPIALGADDFRLTVDTEGFSLANLTSLTGLADLTGTADLSGQLPAEVAKLGSALGQLQPTFAAIALEKREGAYKVAAVDVSIGMPDVTWDVLPGHFTVDDFSASFSIDQPFDGEKRSLDALVRGKIQIEGIPIDIRAERAADFTLYAELGDGRTIRLKELLATYVDKAEAPGDLTIDMLTVEVTPGKAYDMAMTLASEPHPWEIPIATKTLTVSDVTLALGYRAGEAGGAGETSGRFGGTIALGEAHMTLDYEIPGNVTIKADLPSIGLTDLAREIANVADLPIPPGFPDIALTRSRVTFERMTRESAVLYDFALNTVVTIDGTEGLNLAAVVLKGKSSTGMAVGIWTPMWEDGKGWSPGSLWQPLSALEVNSAGLVLSSIAANQSQKAKIVPTSDVPAIASKTFEIVHGVTFFASLGLRTGQVAMLKEVFGERTLFDLYASYDTSSKKTALKAHLDGRPTRGAFQFRGFSLNWDSTGTSDVTISAKADGSLSIEDEALDFGLEGKISSKGSVRLELEISDWAHPFGYKRLIVRQFGVFIALDGGVIIGLNGTFSFDTNDGTAFTFSVAGAILDFEAPSALAFSLDSDNDKLLTFGEVLEGITTIDVYDLPPGAEVIPWVAQIKLLDLVLKFRQLAFWAVVADEVEINDTTYRKGFGFKGDITLFDKTVTAYLDVKEAEKQFAGGAEIPEEITIGSVLSLARPATPEVTPDLTLSIDTGSDGSGKGPIMAVSSQIDDTHAHYLYVAASVRFLDVFTADLYGEVSEDGVQYYYRLAAGTSGQGAWAEQEIALLVSREQLAVSAGLNYDFGLKNVTLGGFKLFDRLPVPEVHLPDLHVGIGGNIGAGLTPPQFHLGGHLTFQFMDIDVKPSFDVKVALDDAPEKIADFAALLAKGASQNLKNAMESVMDTADRFAHWVKVHWGYFKDFAKDVAQVLYDAFRIVSREVIKTIMLGIGFLEEVIEQAINMLEMACSMTRAAFEL